MEELACAVSQFGLQALLQHTHALVVLVDSDGTVVSSNPAFDSLKELLPASARFEDHIPSEEKDDFRRRLKIACNSEVASRRVLELITGKDGDCVSYDSLLMPAGPEHALLFADRLAMDPELSRVIDKLNRQVKLFRMEAERAKKIAVRKQTEVEAVIAQAEEVSSIDALTFLPNRRQIIRALQDEVLRAQRYNGLLSISMVDLDHFKRINDTYGHPAGDHVLREVALLLRNSIRHPDMVGRYGGEEFLILLPNSSHEGASIQAGRLCEQIRHSVIQADEHEINVTLSIGIAQFQNGLDTWQTLLNRADTAMYKVKTAGRDSWAVLEA
jgi:diguanylate cyclase (GGDEF)-like protein